MAQYSKSLQTKVDLLLSAMEPCVPVPMEPTLLADLVEKAKDYALMHGEQSNLVSWARRIIERSITRLNLSRNLHAAEGCVRSGCAALRAVPPLAVALPGDRVPESLEITGKNLRTTEI